MSKKNKERKSILSEKSGSTKSAISDQKDEKSEFPLSPKKELTEQKFTKMKSHGITRGKNSGQEEAWNAELQRVKLNFGSKRCIVKSSKHINYKKTNNIEMVMGAMPTIKAPPDITLATQFTQKLPKTHNDKQTLKPQKSVLEGPLLEIEETKRRKMRCMLNCFDCPDSELDCKRCKGKRYDLKTYKSFYGYSFPHVYNKRKKKRMKSECLPCCLCKCSLISAAIFGTCCLDSCANGCACNGCGKTCGTRCGGCLGGRFCKDNCHSGNIRTCDCVYMCGCSEQSGGCCGCMEPICGCIGSYLCCCLKSLICGSA